MDKNQALRRLPKVDAVLSDARIAALSLPRGAVIAAIRERLEELRQGILNGTLEAPPDIDKICADICVGARQAQTLSPRSVINATGIALHTNLGRACLSERAKRAVNAACGYCALEYDLETGQRGERGGNIERLLRRLTGAEAGMAVNNNAAAVLLVLCCIGNGGEIITSRGELVEIGGSFRMPDIMRQSGCTLREVGATNKTRIEDYEAAVNENTGALLKVHTSNYKITGFTESVPLEALSKLGKRLGIPVIADIGSGCMTDIGLDEPTAPESISSGADVVCFSGDKLLGGPQAGIIIGKSVYLNALKKHPLARALRMDKLTLAALEATLYEYADADNAAREIPVLRMLTQTTEAVKARAERLRAALESSSVPCELVKTQTPAGGGSAPDKTLESFAVAITPKDMTADAFEYALRHASTPVIGRIYKDRCLLDARALSDGDIPALVCSVLEALE